MLKGSVELNELVTGSVLKLNAEGHIESKPRECKDKIVSIEKWTDAFIVFSSIYLAKFPEKVHELLHYVFNVRESALNKGGFAWRAYDEQFRLRQVFSPATWAKINTDLWWRCTQNREPLGGSASPLSRPVLASNKFSCHDFNNGFCKWPNCRFSHTCAGCGGHHSHVNCQRHRESNHTPTGQSAMRSQSTSRGRNYNNAFRGRGRAFFRGARH